MRVTEVILVENVEIIQLDEGPKLDAAKAMAKAGLKAVGKGAAALGKGALKAAPAVGQAVGSTIGAAAGGLAGGVVRGFKGAKAGQTGYDDETPAKTTATGKTSAASTAPSSQSGAPAMSLAQIQSAVVALPPAEQKKLLVLLQKLVPASPAKAAPAVAAPAKNKAALLKAPAAKTTPKYATTP